MSSRRRYSRSIEEPDEYEETQAELARQGGLLHERSIFNVGFLFGLGFVTAQAAFGVLIVFIAMLIGVL